MRSESLMYSRSLDFGEVCDDQVSKPEGRWKVGLTIGRLRERKGY